jgi:hypothetical protein
MNASNMSVEPNNATSSRSAGGTTNLKFLIDNGIHRWDNWAYTRYITASAGDTINPTVSSFDEVSFSMAEFIQTIQQNFEFAKNWGELPCDRYGNPT